MKQGGQKKHNRSGEGITAASVARGFLHLKIWQLLVIIVIMTTFTVIALRVNNSGAVELRRAVLSADKAGDDARTLNALIALQHHVSQHMNSDSMPVVYLQGKYDRDVKAQYEAAKNDNNPNGNILKKADDICKTRFPGYSTAYVFCVAEEQAKFAPSAELQTELELPDVSLYRYSYKAPFWSPDFAGWLVVVTALLVVWTIGRVVGVLALHAYVWFLRRR